MPPTSRNPQAPLPPTFQSLAGSNTYISSIDPSSGLPRISGLPYDQLIIRAQYPQPHILESEPKTLQACLFMHQCLPDLVQRVAQLYVEICRQLYPTIPYSEVVRRKQIVTINLRDFDGLAYTHDDMIEISTRYITNLSKNNETGADITGSARFELEGLLIHEMVHILQFDGGQTAPGWWIEGLADYVRFRAGLGAKHWIKEGEGGSYTAGYETTGLFLDWIEKQEQWKILVKRLNERLQKEKYDEGWWEEMTGGHKVEEMWEFYKAATAP